MVLTKLKSDRNCILFIIHDHYLFKLVLYQVHLLIFQQMASPSGYHNPCHVDHHLRSCLGFNISDSSRSTFARTTTSLVGKEFAGIIIIVVINKSISSLLPFIFVKNLSSLHQYLQPRQLFALSLSTIPLCHKSTLGNY